MLEIRGRADRPRHRSPDRIGSGSDGGLAESGPLWGVVRLSARIGLGGSREVRSDLPAATPVPLTTHYQAKSLTMP